MVDKNDPLFREVDEELRREQWAKLWDKYGLYAVVAAALFVAMVAGYKLWEARRLAFDQATGAQYEAAVKLVNEGKSEEAAKAIEAIVASGHPGYKMLAELELAGSYIKAGKHQEALAIFDRLASDAGTDPMIASFARLQAAALRLGEADFTEMQNRLTPLLGDDSPWRYTARELLGTAAFKAGKIAEARGAFAPLLADAKVPKDTRERVQMMMASIAAAELKAMPTAAAEAGGNPAPGAEAATEKPAATPK
jgi:hypothetical protein